MKAAKKILLSLAFTVPAFAQTNATYLLISSNTVSPSSPTTTIGVWTTWVDPGVEFVFIRSNYDLTAGDGFFSNPVDVLLGPNSTTGVITGNLITGANNGQLTTPLWPRFWSRDNPILLATYDWTATDFTPRTVDLHTSNTSTFVVGVFATGSTRQLYPQEFTPGAGFINVVPAPAAWLVFALPLATAARRRRP